MSFDYAKLRGRMAEMRMTISELSEVTGIPVSTLSNKLNGLTEFKSSEIVLIAEKLDISDIDLYFFTKNVH